MRMWRSKVAFRPQDDCFNTTLPLTPHVTVLRDTDVMLPSTPITPLVWQVDQCVLIHSRLGEQPQYDELGRLPFCQRDSRADSLPET